MTIDRRLPLDAKVTKTFSAKDTKVSVPLGTRFRYDFTKDPTATWHVTPAESAQVLLVDTASAGTGHAYELTFDAVERGTAELTFTYTSGLDPTPPGTVPTPFIVIVTVT